MLFIVDDRNIFICMCLHMRSLVSASSWSVFLIDTFKTHSGDVKERPLAYNSENVNLGN